MLRNQSWIRPVVVVVVLSRCASSIKSHGNLQRRAPLPAPKIDEGGSLSRIVFILMAMLWLGCNIYREIAVVRAQSTNIREQPHIDLCAHLHTLPSHAYIPSLTQPIVSFASPPKSPNWQKRSSSLPKLRIPTGSTARTPSHFWPQHTRCHLFS